MNLRQKIALAGILFAAAGAQAQIVPTLSSVTPQGGGDYLYDYAVYVDAGTTVNFNDYFTIYDTYGLQSISTPPTSWTATSQNIGETPVGAAPPDSVTTPNITWTYTGGPSIVGDPGVGYTFLGDFDFISTQGQYTSPEAGFYSYEAIEGDNNSSQSGVSTVSTPLAPEPAALGISAAAILSLRRRK